MKAIIKENWPTKGPRYWMIKSGRKDIACIFFPLEGVSDTFSVEVYHGIFTAFDGIESMDEAVKTCKDALNDYFGISEITNSKGYPIEMIVLFEGLSSKDVLPDNYWFVVSDLLTTESYKSMKGALARFEERLQFYEKHRPSIVDRHEYKVKKLVTDRLNLKRTAKISSSLPPGTIITLSFEAFRTY